MENAVLDVQGRPLWSDIWAESCAAREQAMQIRRRSVLFQAQGQ